MNATKTPYHFRTTITFQISEFKGSGLLRCFIDCLYNMLKIGSIQTFGLKGTLLYQESGLGKLHCTKYADAHRIHIHVLYFLE